MPGLTDEEIALFLAEPHIAVLGTINADGTPALNPVWYLHEDGKLWVIIPAKSYYGLNVQRDPRIAICVQQENRPYKAAVARGKAVVEAEGKATGETLRRMAIRYLGEADGNAYAEGNSGERDILVSLRPEKLGTWDYGKE